MEENKGKISRKQALEIISQQVEAYKQASRLEQGKILDSLQSVLKRPRKSLIRTLNSCAIKQSRAIQKMSCVDKAAFAYSKDNPRNHQETRGRPHKYTKEAEAALVEIWEAYNYICAERLHPQISSAITIFKRDNDWHYSDQATTLLTSMPLGTMKSYLVRFAKDRGLMRGFSTTRSSEVLNAVPIFHGDWKTKSLGYGQIDTVVHSGSRLEGTMVYTVNYIEMQTYWQEFRAQLGKTAETTRNTISRLIQKLPFRASGIHSDSGDEFINAILVSWCNHRHIEFTRSRPHEKNDNCNVEERNNHVIRYYVGYERYDCVEAVNALNELYSVLRLYVNYFQPIMKLKSKTRLPNGNYIRKYEEAKTPYERVLKHADVSQSIKDKLIAEYQTLNPKRLLATIKALTINLERIQREQGYHFNTEA